MLLFTTATQDKMAALSAPSLNLIDTCGSQLSTRRRYLADKEQPLCVLSIWKGCMLIITPVYVSTRLKQKAQPDGCTC